MIHPGHRGIRLTVECANALDFRADVLALKYAQANYGADRAVLNRLREKYEDLEIQPAPNSAMLVRSGGQVAAPLVLFVGVRPLRVFGYDDIRDFGRAVLEILAPAMPRLPEDQGSGAGPAQRAK